MSKKKKKKTPNQNFRKRENAKRKKDRMAKKKKRKNIVGRTFSSTPSTHELLLIFFSFWRNCILVGPTWIHGCQNPDLDSTILRFYDSTCPKRFKYFKDLCGRSGSVGSYDFADPKRPWFLVIFFNLTASSVRPK